MPRRRKHLNPPLLDKLLFGVNLARNEEAPSEIGRGGVRLNPAARLDAFDEQEFRYTLRRDIAWLLNAVQLGSDHDLSAYPQLEKSVLNYGAVSLIGRSISDESIEERGEAIREAIHNFEPRIDPRTLSVKHETVGERVNSVTYVVSGRARSADDVIEISFRTDLALDSGAATVRD